MTIWWCEKHEVGLTQSGECSSCNNEEANMEQGELTDDTTVSDLFDTIVPGFKEWADAGAGRDNYQHFLDTFEVTRPGASEEKVLALAKSTYLTEVFANIGNKQALLLQVISFISLGYFLALKEYKLLEKDLN